MSARRRFPFNVVAGEDGADFNYLIYCWVVQSVHHVI